MDTRSDLFQFRYGFVASLFSRLEKRRGLGSAFFFFSGGRIAQRAFCICSSTYLGLGWVGVRRRQTEADLGIAG